MDWGSARKRTLGHLKAIILGTCAHLGAPGTKKCSKGCLKRSPRYQDYQKITSKLPKSISRAPRLHTFYSVLPWSGGMRVASRTIQYGNLRYGVRFCCTFPAPQNTPTFTAKSSAGPWSLTALLFGVAGAPEAGTPLNLELTFYGKTFIYMYFTLPRTGLHQLPLHHSSRVGGMRRQPDKLNFLKIRPPCLQGTGRVRVLC